MKRNFEVTREVCERNFGRLEKALREVRGVKVRDIESWRGLRMGR